jgi:hypothetical protein
MRNWILVAVAAATTIPAILREFRNAPAAIPEPCGTGA